MEFLRICSGGVFAFAMVGTLSLPGQQKSGSESRPPPPIGTLGQTVSQGQNPLGTQPHTPDPKAAEIQAMRRRELQRTLLADSVKLQDAVQELQTEISKSGDQTLSLAAVKKAEDVEKMAKALKNKLKSQ